MLRTDFFSLKGSGTFVRVRGILSSLKSPMMICFQFTVRGIQREHDDIDTNKITNKSGRETGPQHHTLSTFFYSLTE